MDTKPFYLLLEMNPVVGVFTYGKKYCHKPGLLDMPV